MTVKLKRLRRFNEIEPPQQPLQQQNPFHEDYSDDEILLKCSKKRIETLSDDDLISQDEHQCSYESSSTVTTVDTSDFIVSTSDDSEEVDQVVQDQLEAHAIRSRSSTELDLACFRKQDPKHNFYVFIECLCKQSINDDFLFDFQSVSSKRNYYYTQALKAIDNELLTRIHYVSSNIWTRKLRTGLVGHSFLTYYAISIPINSICYACNRTKLNHYRFKLYGDGYDFNSLKKSQELSGTQEGFIGTTCLHKIKAYHELYWYKLKMLKKVKSQLNGLNKDQMDRLLKNNDILDLWYLEYSAMLERIDGDTV